MNLVKSCGAVIYWKSGEKLEFLSVKSKANGCWGFPKGRMEKGESEKETAIREVFEETGLSITLLDGFRSKVEYQLPDSTLKEVVYFIGVTPDTSVNIQHEEIEQFKWQDFIITLNLQTYESNKNVLIEAEGFLNSSGS